MGNQKRHFSTDLNKTLKLGKRTHIIIRTERTKYGKLGFITIIFTL